MKGSLSFLLSGPGLIGEKHAALIQDQPDAALAAVVAPDSAKNRAFAEARNAAFYTNVAQALDCESIDAAIISSPNEFHYEQAIQCLNHAVPVLVEKPLTDNLDNAAALAEASRLKGVPVLVGHHRTYSPLLQVARSFLNSQAFGRLVCVQGCALFYKPDGYFEAGPWRTRKGGGPILINLIHEIGILRYLCGEITSVSTTKSRAIRDFEVEDSAAVVLTFENGAIGTFLLSDTAASSKSWEMTAGENPAYPHFPSQDCYHFAGDMGSLDFPSMRTRTYLGASEKSWWRAFAEDQMALEHQDPLACQLDHFVDVVANRATPAVTAWDGYANMVVLEAIEQAATQERVVHVAEVTPMSSATVKNT